MTYRNTPLTMVHPVWPRTMLKLFLTIFSVSQNSENIAFTLYDEWGILTLITVS